MLTLILYHSVPYVNNLIGLEGFINLKHVTNKSFVRQGFVHADSLSTLVENANAYIVINASLIL